MFSISIPIEGTIFRAALVFYNPWNICHNVAGSRQSDFIMNLLRRLNWHNWMYFQRLDMTFDNTAFSLRLKDIFCWIYAWEFIYSYTSDSVISQTSLVVLNAFCYWVRSVAIDWYQGNFKLTNTDIHRFAPWLTFEYLTRTDALWTIAEQPLCKNIV